MNRRSVGMRTNSCDHEARSPGGAAAPAPRRGRVRVAARAAAARSTEAREEFPRAKNGVAMQLDPTDVHEADLALQRAEQAFRD